jgi:hypothetical protein
MSASYAIIRSGVLDHLIRGKIGYVDLGVYVTVHLQADFSTGICWTSAPRLLGSAPRGATLRDLQRSLQTLRESLFLRSFHVDGQRGNYALLIHKYDVKLGALRGKRLNAWKSSSWEHPIYEVCAESVAEAAPYQYPESKKKKKQNPAASPPDVRFTPVFDHAYQTFREKFGNPPSWNGKHHRALKDLLVGNTSLSIEEICRRWDNFLGSGESFTTKQGGSLHFFCGRIDCYIQGPLFDSVRGKTTHERDNAATDAVLDELRSSSGGVASHLVQAALAKRPS